VFDTQWSEVTVNPSLPNDAFRPPAALRGKAPTPAAIGKVPYQWIIRRLALSFYLDSDAIYNDGGNIQLTDVGPNISMVTGASHNTLIVDAGKYLVAFDSPIDDGLSQKSIEMAKAKYPGKPFKYVVLTHHHIDHTGGIRAYAAEGATIVVGKGDGAFFRKVLSASAGLNPFPVKQVAPKVIEVNGKWSVSDGGRTVEAYAIDNPHAQGYLIPYVPDAKLGFVTDIWSPGPMPPTASNPMLVSLVRGVEKAGIQPEKFAGGHGGVGDYTDLVKIVGPAR
jgi:glyoxylase-like metal-dependent hydrolase (beta-lactamase superfamily II)